MTTRCRLPAERMRSVGSSDDADDKDDVDVSTTEVDTANAA